MGKWESIMTVTPCKYVHVVPEQTGYNQLII